MIVLCGYLFYAQSLTNLEGPEPINFLIDKHLHLQGMLHISISSSNLEIYTICVQVIELTGD